MGKYLEGTERWVLRASQNTMYSLNALSNQMKPSHGHKMDM